MILNKQQQSLLLSVAKQSTLSGLDGFLMANIIEWLNEVELGSFSDNNNDLLWQPAATFVTFNKKQSLRGCIGSLQAVRPLLEDVAHNTFNAAFRDPRFQPIERDESPELNVEISVLSKPEPMKTSASFEDFLEQLEPFKDGLILSEGFNKATFLPSVWEQLPNKQDFVLQLMRKAGIYQWSKNVKSERYYANAFSANWHDITPLESGI